jgi:hypothetical protein
MKKQMIALLAGALLMISAGSALASFDDLNLIRVVYGTTNEVGTDLGSISTLLPGNAAPGSAITLSTGASNFVSMGAGATGAGSKDYVAYYAVDPFGTGAAYFSATNTGIGSTLTVDTTNLPLAAQNLSASGLTSAWYAGLVKTTDASGATSVVGLKSNGNSYAYNFNAGANYSGISNLSGGISALADAPLTAAATQGLFYWDGTSSTATEIATITTNLIGSTTINPNATPTPVPAAAYLFGSGLMGLFGLRRKNQK